MNDQPNSPEVAPQADAEEEASAGNEVVQAVKELTAAKERWSPNARKVGMGAAIGVGSAAIVAGLLYWRGGKR